MMLLLLIVICQDSYNYRQNNKELTLIRNMRCNLLYTKFITYLSHADSEYMYHAWTYYLQIYKLQQKQCIF